MDAITDTQVRASFVNATRGEAKRINLPDLDAQPWAELDFLGWVDPKAPQQAYLVAPGIAGTPAADRPTGVKLRRNNAGFGGGTRMCSICCTVHPASGVTLMVAPRAGKAGRDGNTVGIDVCSDLRCSGYVRGWAPLPPISRIGETTSVDDKVARLLVNLETFLRRVQR
ncbi:FBP domain-containing protein [Nocardioides sp. C4-1]|uniref:FBP domain-containing protein n=1 Tax=Nocardioides sp. C4-1 TaxID=3151851 RepID=UPI003262FC85